MPSSIQTTQTTSISARLARFADHIFRPTSWWLLLLALPAMTPLFTQGLPNRVDRGLHLIRIAILDHNIRQGNLFPRWMPEMMLGRGYPLLTFYGAGVYYLHEIPLLLGLPIYDASILVLVCLTLAAGFGMYALTADLFSGRSRWAPLVCAVAYMYAPYFLITNLYMRGAIAEVMAQALLPWTLWSTRRVFYSDRPARYAVLTALVVACTIYSHTLSILIAPPLLTAFTLFLWWDTGRPNSRMMWVLTAGFMALALTAFFWLPLVIRRSDISTVGYAIAQGSYLPNGTWSWSTFLDDGIFYTYRRSGEPPRVGLVQFVLALAGAVLVLAKARTRELLFFLIVGAIAALGIGRWALPIWSSSDILASIQHPYRLLSIVTLSVAILTGAIVAYFPYSRWKPIVAIGIIMLYIFVNYPRLGLPLPVFARDTTLVTLPAVAQTEAEQGVEQGGELSSMVQEFRPRRAAPNLVYDGDEPDTPALDIGVTHANAQETILSITTAEPSRQRFNDFYFPGWYAQLDQSTHLPVSASTKLGLVTVDLPPGAHQLALRYNGGVVERLAGLVSIASALCLALLAWRYRQRWLAIAPMLLFAWGVAALFYQPPVKATQELISGWDESGIQLAGIRYEQPNQNTVLLYPYWYVRSIQEADTVFRWQLVDEDGAVLSESIAYPFFNASSAATWPPGTLVDDAAQLTLPPGIGAGEYALGLSVGSSGVDGEFTDPRGVTSITLSRPSGDEEIGGYTSAGAVFDDKAELVGFTARSSGRLLPYNEVSPPVLKPGDTVRYNLQWRALAPLSRNYHSYVHLNDVHGVSLTKQDQLPGPFFRPPKIWDTYRLQRDSHLLRIPEDAPGGLYWPSVGLYDFDDLSMLPVTENGQPVPGDNYRLPPVKILGQPSKPEVEVDAHFQDGFRLKGYTLDLPNGTLSPGQTMTVTLSFDNNQQGSRDVTRFVHLYDPELGMAAQYDSQPQAGVNPTDSWLAGEQITDQIALTVADNAVAGTYKLLIGFYDPKLDASRLAVTDDTGVQFANNAVVLTDLLVETLDK